MSGTQLPTMLTTPRAAAQVFTQTGGYPKQRHTFLVRFIRGQSTNVNTSTITFVVKAADRPSIETKVEELNQYNKKRQIYTGYKTQPIKVQMYDSADSIGLRMWDEYSKWHFGDFAQTASSYIYDVTTGGDSTSGGGFQDNGSGFGFVGSYGGSTNPDSQFYFTSVDILHFYGGTYDLYSLINPRITSFTPDELDYETGTVSMINLTLAYEAVLYSINAPSFGLDAASAIAEFQSGAPFDSATPDISGSTSDQSSGQTGPINTSFVDTGNVQNILTMANPTGTIPVTADDSRYYSSSSGGALGVYGNYVYGDTTSSAPIAPGSTGNLAYLATNNPALTAALNLNTPVTGAQVVPGAVTAPSYGIDAGAYNAVSGTVASNSSTGPAGALVTQGVLASSALNNTGVSSTADGLVLSNSAYGALNAVRPGGAQYGINPNFAGSTLSGGSYANANTFIPGTGTPTLPQPGDDALLGA